MPNIFLWHFLPNGKLLDASSFEIKEDAEANNITKCGVMGKEWARTRAEQNGKLP